MSKTTNFTPSIVGEWETEKYRSQLGDAISYYNFNSDQTYSARMQLINVGMNMEQKGTYKVSNDTIEFVVNGRIVKSKFILTNETFTLYDGPEAKIVHVRK